MKKRAFFAVLGVFLLGLMSGVILAQLSPTPASWGWKTDQGHSQPGKRGGERRRFVDKLSRELNLSEKQRAAISPILQEAHYALYQARLQSFERYDEIIDGLDKRIRPALMPEQIEKLDELTDKYHRRRLKKRERIMRRMKSIEQTSGSGSKRS